MSDSKNELTLSRAPDGAATPPAPDPGAAAEPEYLKFRVTPEQFLETRRGGQTVYVFDLRDSDAFDQGHIPGAYSLPMDHVEPNLHRLPFSGDLLLYDAGDGLTRQAAAILHDNGFTDFSFVEEGLAAIRAAMAQSKDEVNYLALEPGARAAKVEEVLNVKVRDFLARDGGGMEVVAIEDDRVLVSYQGACGSCSSSTAGTLKFIQNVLTISLNHEIEVVPVDG
jgi:Fe-S cluster biogenesis protein NfuA/rhodanese-related sulfurtransferase